MWPEEPVRPEGPVSPAEPGSPAEPASRGGPGRPAGTRRTPGGAPGGGAPRTRHADVPRFAPQAVHKPGDAVDTPAGSGDHAGSEPGPGGSAPPVGGTTTPAEPLVGVDIARRALEEARAAAKARGAEVGRGRAAPARSRGTGASQTRGRRRRWSGPGPDDRDPQTLGNLTAGLVRTRGWSEEVAAGTVLGRWNTLVGREIADHAQPESLVGGVLLVRTDSTAWATQLRLLQRQLLARIAASVGHGVVTSMSVQGPTAPSWKRGVRTVRGGRGPRDTYG